jgi:glutathione S-transferase
MELYFYEDCEYSQIVINTIANLNISEKFIFKDIRENNEYAKELYDISGNETVPCLLTEKGPLKEAIEIRKYLVSKYG